MILWSGSVLVFLKPKMLILTRKKGTVSYMLPPEQKVKGNMSNKVPDTEPSLAWFRLLLFISLEPSCLNSRYNWNCETFFLNVHYFFAMEDGFTLLWFTAVHISACVHFCCKFNRVQSITATLWIGKVKDKMLLTVYKFSTKSKQRSNVHRDKQCTGVHIAETWVNDWHSILISERKKGWREAENVEEARGGGRNW